MSSVPATGAVMDLHLPVWTGLVGSTGAVPLLPAFGSTIGVDGSTGVVGGVMTPVPLYHWHPPTQLISVSSLAQSSKLTLWRVILAGAQKS